MTRIDRFAVGRQRGAVLVVSLVMLVVLTLLGVSVMNITQLEERMAANTQELAQAFQLSETGLAMAFGNEDTWNPANTTGDDIVVENVNRKDRTSFTTRFLAYSNPPTGYDVAQYQRAHFDFHGTGKTGENDTTGSNFEAELHGGGAQVFRRTGIVE